MTRNLKIAVIGGGSSYTPEIAEGFIKKSISGELPVKDLYLVDIDEGRGKIKLEIVGNLVKRMVEEAGADINVHTTLSRREALKGADFVTTQFRVGQLESRIRDERIPLEYNLVGQETTGVGGFMKAQRTIPVILDLCKDMEELCPDAWLINFTNPSGIITETVLKHTKIKIIGLCNIPISTLNTIAGLYNVPVEDIYVRFAGLNHFVWGTKIYKKGVDVTEEVLNLFKERKIGSPASLPRLPWDDEVVDAIGALPCSYHRYYYLKDFMLELCKTEASGQGTRGEMVLKLEEELFEVYKDPNMRIKPPQLANRGGAHYSEAAVNLITSIYNDKKDIQCVDVRNNGTILDLPEDVCVECCCVIDKNGAHPIGIGHLNKQIRGLLQIVKAYEELAIEAGVNGDYNDALNALTIHPLINDSSAAKKVLDDCLLANREYLPQYEGYFKSIILNDL